MKDISSNSKLLETTTAVETTPEEGVEE